MLLRAVVSAWWGLIAAEWRGRGTAGGGGGWEMGDELLATIFGI